MKHLLNIGILGTLLSLVMCQDILEPDISSARVMINSPSDGISVASDSLTLWWEPVEGASGYAVSVVNPSFLAAERLMLDSITDAQSVEVKLPVGDYEWRVYAFNSAYSTDFTYATFTIGAGEQQQDSVDLTDEVISLRAPADNLILDSAVINFWWENEVIDSFRLTIVRPSFDQPEILVLDTGLAINTFRYQFSPGTYSWRVRGYGVNTSTADFLAAFTVIDSDTVDTEIDLSSSLVNLLTPSDSLTTAEGNVVFWWDKVAGADSYEIVVLQPDFTNPRSIVFDETREDQRVQFSLDSGNYQWGVRAINATSESSYTIRTLFIQ